MILSLAILIILSLIFSRLFEKLQLPGLIGMLIAGILIGDSSGDYFYHILNNNEYNLLKWDRQERIYYPIRINLYEKGEIDEQALL